ncbi:hypothetical protein QYE76_068581 [Lolium multiflorum]|uniref:Reverse transcriptase Ty1/copia-type domain-containing protein n=1 Tax=Lolium multiflorum TaxID=4521 RepID=A0AAD8WBV2_LOLMU|nr:hypothetical protein QYE76_068581 [Lolium multiflorum]
MPRAPPTPRQSDLNFDNFSETLPVMATGGTAPPNFFSFPPPPPPRASHPLLGIHIQDYIKFQLTTTGVNFSKWRQTIVLLLTMHHALDHITDGAAPSNPSDEWRAVDIHLSLWFMATLSDDLYRLVQGSTANACTTWTRINAFFVNNRTSRYAYLSKALRNTPRGDLTVSAYASKLQAIADDLAAIGRPVSDVDLTMQFIDGIGKKFKLQAQILKSGDLLPTFADACARFQLAEIDEDSEQASESAHAMAVHGGGRGHTGGGASGSGTGAPPRPLGVIPNYKGKNPIPGFVHPNQAAAHAGSSQAGRGRGRGAPHGRGDISGGHAGRDQPWRGYFAPMGMPFPTRMPWMPPNSGSVYGPRPGNPTQAYQMMTAPAAPAASYQTAPSAPLYQSQPSPAYQPPSWDQAALLSQAPSYGSAFPAHGDWIMDSGATTHVTGNQGFLSSKSDTSLFIMHTATTTAYLLLYVDDIILTASSTTTLNHIIDLLNAEFAMTDLGDVHHFLGVNVLRTPCGLFLSQQQYALELLDRANMLNCNPITTPVDTKSKLSGNDGRKVADPSEYRSLAGALQYLTLTRPDLSYAVQQICLFMHDPRESHLQLVKRILRYVQGTSHLGLQIYADTSRELVAYSDADWAGCPDTRKSTSGFGVFLGNNLVSWSSKRQNTVSRSSAEAEYRAVANVVAESVWLRQLLHELHQPIASATVVYCDNISATYLSSNPIQHQRTKHIEIDLHFVRDRVALGEARVLHVPTSSQYADIFTKGLPTAVFQEFRSSLNVLPSPVATAGGC